MKTSFVILAGGEARRMGKDKKFIKFRGRYFIEHAIKLAEHVSDDIIISVGKNEELNLATTHRVVNDEIEVKAPVVGILSSFKHCKYSYACVFPCDSPLAVSAVFKFMALRCRGYDGVVPKDGDYIEPLHAVYRVKSMLRACREAVGRQEYSLHKIIKNLKINYLDVSLLRKFDKQLLTFRNINTPADLEELEKYEDI